MSVFVDYKWHILITAEVLFWVFSTTFLILRYWFQLNRASLIFLVLFIVNDLFILFLGVWDYMQTGQFSNYQLIIAVILIYALTYGRKDFKRLDRYLKRKVESWKQPSRPVAQTDRAEQKQRGFDWEHARRERSGWYKHLFIFLFAYGSYRLLTWLQWEVISFNVLSNIFYIWTIIFIVDTIYSLSFTLFPRKKRED